jgi:hypothetical protein
VVEDLAVDSWEASVESIEVRGSFESVAGDVY